MSNDILALQAKITLTLPNKVRISVYGEHKQFIDISVTMAVFVPGNHTIYALRGRSKDKETLLAELASVVRNAAVRAFRGV
jgi:hypothetical protein